MNKPLIIRTDNRQMIMIMVIKGKDADMSGVNIDRGLIHRRSHEETSGPRPATANTCTTVNRMGRCVKT